MLMKDAQRILAEITSQQWGLVTTKQAGLRGVTRLQLSRLADDGALSRCAWGVYRDSGAPGGQYEDIRVSWLSIRPDLMAYERLAQRPGDAVVSGAAAAWLHDLGTLVPEPYEFTVPKRRQTQRPDMAFRTRQLPGESVTLRHGLPVTTVEQTIADLVERNVDLSLVADVISEANSIDSAAVVSRLEPLARRNGFAAGSELWDYLIKIAGRDVQTIARRIALSSLGPEIVKECLDQMFKASNVITIAPDAMYTWRQISDQISAAMPKVDWPKTYPSIVPRPLATHSTEIGKDFNRALQSTIPRVPSMISNRDGSQGILKVGSWINV